MTYDPIKSRSSAESFALGYAGSVIPEPGALGSFGSGQVRDGLSLWLNGYGNEVTPILERGLTWLDHALTTDERFGPPNSPHWWRERLWMSKALGHWMLGQGPEEQAAWRQAIECSTFSFEHETGVYANRDLTTRRLDSFMAYCVLAGEFARGAAEYERFNAARRAAPSKANTARAVAYAICRHEIAGDADLAAVQAAGHRLLTKHLEDDWLDTGQWLTAAVWLHVVHARPTLHPVAGAQPTSARTAVLRAYDHMPHVTKPDFVR